jgi:hypothetical protein
VLFCFTISCVRFGVFIGGMLLGVWWVACSLVFWLVACCLVVVFCSVLFSVMVSSVLLNVTISSALFFSHAHFFVSHRILIGVGTCTVLPTIVRGNRMVCKWCCFYSVTSVHVLGHSLCQSLSLALSTAFTVHCHRKCLCNSYCCCAFALVLL